MKAVERIGWNLRKLRVTKGISQDDLAYRAELDHAYIGYVERGKRNVTVGTLERIATALDIDIADLLAPVPENSKELAPLKNGRKKKIT